MTYTQSMAKRLKLKPYIDQLEFWPEKGQSILAQYDADSIVLYQAFKKGIAIWALEHQAFGGSDFSFDRMTWIKPNFLWMMQRSKWATEPDQKHVLAIWLKREGFDAMLAQAVPAKFRDEVYPNNEAWQKALEASDVVVQWDPDYTPMGQKTNRRDIQLGLRGETLRKYATEWIMQIEDITPTVREQAGYLPEEEMIFTPAEKVYPIKDAEISKRVGIKI